MAVPVPISVPIPVRQSARMSFAVREIKGILSSKVLNTFNKLSLVSRLLCTHHVLRERNELSDDNLSVRRVCLPASCPQYLQVERSRHSHRELRVL